MEQAIEYPQAEKAGKYRRCSIKHPDRRNLGKNQSSNITQDLKHYLPPPIQEKTVLRIPKAAETRKTSRKLIRTYSRNSYPAGGEPTKARNSSIKETDIQSPPSQEAQSQNTKGQKNHHQDGHRLPRQSLRSILQERDIAIKNAGNSKVLIIIAG